MSLCLTCMNKDCQSQGRVNGYTYCRDYSELKSPQNLPKADACSLLAEVRAVEKALEIMGELIQYHQHHCEVEMNEEKVIRGKALKAIQKISEHFS